MLHRRPFYFTEYGSANKIAASNTGTAVWCLDAWFRGASGEFVSISLFHKPQLPHSHPHPSTTTRKFEPSPLPQNILHEIRTRNQVSQTVFAAVLGIGKTTVQHWEQGVKKPSGPARRLLDLVDREGLSIFGLTNPK
jgi:DNA-binding transcriptional regulator YiaG